MGQFSIQPLFPTPIYIEQLEARSNIDLIQDEISLGLSTTVMNAPGSHKFSEQLGHNICPGEFDGDWLKEKACISFITGLNGAVERYCQYTGFPATDVYDPDNLKYSRKSWINEFGKGTYAHCHHHSTADIAGVYYYQTSGDDGSIYFESPVSEAGCTPAWVQLNERFNIPPKVGLLIMFPGWLRHGVSTNRTDSKRISLSWNINFKTGTST
jgi:hypothetical protein